MLGVSFYATNSRGYLNRIGTLEIRNDATGNFKIASYDVTYTDEETLRVTQVRIENYKREQGPLILVKLAIEKLEKIGAAKVLSLTDMLTLAGMEDGESKNEGDHRER